MPSISDVCNVLSWVCCGRMVVKHKGVSQYIDFGTNIGHFFMFAWLRVI